jgi:hypothetical protein
MGAKTLLVGVGYDTGSMGGGLTMTFVDNEWDGSIADAFARARVVVARSSSSSNRNNEGGGI